MDWIQDCFPRQVTRPQAHSEAECRKYRTSHNKLCGPKQGHHLHNISPDNDQYYGPETRGPANGKNTPDDGDQHYPRRTTNTNVQNKRVFG